VAGATVDERNGTALAAASQLVANALLRARSLPTAPASNVACRRELVLEIAFDESYLGIGGEERDWYARLAARGHGFALEPRAVVVHRKRLTLTAFWRQHVRYGRGAYRFRRIHLRGQLEPASFYAELVRSGFRRGARAGLAVCLAQLATATGFALEALAERLRRAA
jgi:GT2 family glycosyltransferase